MLHYNSYSLLILELVALFVSKGISEGASWINESPMSYRYSITNNSDQNWCESKSNQIKMAGSHAVKSETTFIYYDMIISMIILPVAKCRHCSLRHLL